MHKSPSAINKLAVVLLSLLVLELILIGQVESIKAIKKKVYLKKLKKLLPILALVKPKKKIILLPIPIPMMQSSGQPAKRPGATHRPYLPYSPYPSSGAPMSFIMMTQPGQVPPETMSMSMLEGNMMDSSPKLEAQEEHLQNLRQKEQLMPIVVPSMTMTIQSEGGGHSAIELSTNLMRGPLTKNYTDHTTSQPIQQQKQEFGMLKVQPIRPPYPPQHTYTDSFTPTHNNNGIAGGEPFYSSPWDTAKAPLSSPMKLFRKDRLREQPSTPYTPTTSSPVHNQRFPTQEHIELEDLVAVGPPQLRPFIQDSSGNLHTQSVNLMSGTLSNNWRPTTTEIEETDEVQTVASEPPVRPRSALKYGHNRQVKGYSSTLRQPTKNLQSYNLKSPAFHP